ncbi:hypothetical protein SAMN04487857_102447 [Pseudomonas sp. ok272]|uniref:hypothetical protein n=1 Tax=unclassified Pseudomonas TaxID=196821 RepID=UPI0008BEBCC3|nr:MULTISPECIES: hypothetical protein [unclassified Pseudomonas]SEM52568.1 hypothetical protein SAMN04487857_102447 [Pseudomonas sp. ok272]SFM24502.1 hypothetical protein SAMN04487858_101449 [Pseudomonas sp. ok602]
MKYRNSLAALMITASLYGCTTQPGHVVSVPLVASRQNTGQIGNVTLADWGDKTGFSFFISGVPNGASLPLRLYTFIHKGSCQQPGPIAYAMNDHVTTERQPVRGWAFSRSAPVAMSALLSGEYAVVVRSAPDSGDIEVFCGDIKQGDSAK